MPRPAPRSSAKLLAELDEGLELIGSPSAKHASLGAYYDRFAVVDGGGKHAGRRFRNCPPGLRPVLAALASDRSTDPMVLRVAYRLGSREAYERVVTLLRSTSTPSATRKELLSIVGEFGEAQDVGPVLAIIRDVHDHGLRLAALATLSHFDSPQIADAVLAEYPRMTPVLRTAARGLLFGRRDWAGQLLAQIDGGAIRVADVPTEEVRPIALYHDAQLDALVQKLWGSVRAGTTEEKLADIRRLSNDLRAAPGRATAGHELFKKNCATCHVLFGEGTKLGPDLTTANRHDREFLLVSVVDPSVQVRKEYLVYAVETQDGRVVTGCIAEQNASSLTLVGPKNDRTTIRRSEIVEMRAMANSLMPEKLLDPLQPQEVRDLFAYLQK